MIGIEPTLERHLAEIADLCRRCQVRRLAAFGSILRADFDAATSDADFLVEFNQLSTAERMRQYMALRTALESLLTRPVDLVEQGAIRNPYVRAEVERSQRVLYAA